jgi:hypothetical protein
LVPNIRFGRWLCGLSLFALMVLFLNSAGLLSAADNSGWAIALFFACIVAYIVPVFHYVTQRAEVALIELANSGLITPEQEVGLLKEVVQRSWRWVLSYFCVATLLWFLQSLLLQGTFSNLVASSTASYPGFVGAISAWLVWVLFTCVVAALVEQARIFRRLALQVRVDVFDTQVLMPFGRFAASSTLVVIVAQAFLAIMWLGEATSAWTTIPPLIPTTGALIYLFLAPIWPIHKNLQIAKKLQLKTAQEQINELTRHQDQDVASLGALLSLRREMTQLPEWPLDLGIVARLGLYLVIVPMTWIGAALIENVVDLFIA